ncbi:MAG TPA: glycerophosphodiester phosphodiesterase [Candidatus Dorea intestinavium]|nr:glycerophosphodiester phosphodiesterase [Candidatus Dorea intestinavium]
MITLCLIYLFLILPRLKNKNDLDNFKKQIFAHRGFHNIKKEIPENSTAAFTRALAMGYGIEIDVHLTKDKRLVVFHDHSLLRVCNAPGEIEDYTFSELKNLRLLDTKETIPSLEEVLALINGQVPLLLELKSVGTSTTLCSYVAEALSTYEGSVFIQSFSPLDLRWFKKHKPQYIRGQLSSDLVKTDQGRPLIPRFFLSHLLCNFLSRPDFISYHYKSLKPVSTFLLHRLFKVPYAVWTLRKKKDYQKLLKDYDFFIIEDFEIMKK